MSDNPEVPKEEVSTYKRKCPNWLNDFGRWTLPRSEAPETFIFWTGLFTLASAVRRHVRIPKSYFGSWEASPNLYILFIAPAGKARKSTTANYAEDLLDEISDVTRSPELVTKEMLLVTLTKSNDQSMCVIAPEFGEFIVKSGVEMYGFLTNMFDGKKRIQAGTLSRGVEFADRPCVNLLGATTPEWVADNMPESVIGGGFASRVIFIYEERVRRRQLYYESLNHDVFDDIKKNLAQDLQHISTLHGDFEIDDDAKDFMEAWYRDNADAGTVEQYKLHGYYERRPAHIHKVAMLLSMAEKDELIVTKDNFISAINLLAQIEKRLPQTFQSIGRNQYTVDMTRILMYLEEKGTTTVEDVKQKFFHVAVPSQLTELLDGIIAAGLASLKLVESKSILELTESGKQLITLRK